MSDIRTRCCAVRWCAAGDEAYLCEAQRVRHFFRQPQVPEMYRVEGAAEDADGRRVYQSSYSTKRRISASVCER